MPDGQAAVVGRSVLPQDISNMRLITVFEGLWYQGGWRLTG